MSKRKLFFGSVMLLLLLLSYGFLSNATLRLIFPNKIRAHKVNTIEKMKEARELFSGLELDVVFHADKNYFEVNHPPDSSINLTLAEYLKENSTNKSCSYWLDFKNLEQVNSANAARNLDSLCKIYSLPNSNFIVESMNPQYLASFQTKGFLTAYYLPTELNLKSEAELNLQILTITEKLKDAKTNYISFDYRDYSIIKKYFPDKRKIAWFTVYGNTNKFEARCILFELGFDEQVDVVLVPYKAKTGNR